MPSASFLVTDGTRIRQNYRMNTMGTGFLNHEIHESHEKI
jgi:hypothetical protein